MATFDEALVLLSRHYTQQVRKQGGRSLARVATVIANRGSFFTSLECGATCSTRNLEKFATFFRDTRNWPGGSVPDEAAVLLTGIGRPVLRAEDFPPILPDRRNSTAPSLEMRT